MFKIEIDIENPNPWEIDDPWLDENGEEDDDDEADEDDDDEDYDEDYDEDDGAGYFY